MLEILPPSLFTPFTLSSLKSEFLILILSNLPIISFEVYVLHAFITDDFLLSPGHNDVRHGSYTQASDLS